MLGFLAALRARQFAWRCLESLCSASKALMFGPRVVWEEAAEMPGLDGAATVLMLCLG